jgi:hypothetical protein
MHFTYYRFLNKNIGGRIDWVATGLIDDLLLCFLCGFLGLLLLVCFLLLNLSALQICIFSFPSSFGDFMLFFSIKKKTGGYDKKLVIWERKHSSEPAWICKHEAG